MAVYLILSILYIGTSAALIQGARKVDMDIININSKYNFYTESSGTFNALGCVDCFLPDVWYLQHSCRIPWLHSHCLSCQQYNRISQPGLLLHLCLVIQVKLSELFLWNIYNENFKESSQSGWSSGICLKAALVESQCNFAFAIFNYYAVLTAGY